ncbi:MAG: hypothetical protein QNJ12_15585 [Ilumatobacter sp.]|uniref:hypothetical protein n=1 Tax=Ilumatobacter sp. TaxID=1967498 RepID=UPI00261AAEAC|nr:hypothetical protein [Ilumatobacter sp.]MDJ0770222.1 hypothetical protein [Ilumatobacter sp.]
MIRVGLAVLRHPSLWATALRQLRRTAAPGWWRRPPFLPLPAGDYLHFRMVTQYGETDRPPDPDDVLDYLAWCRDWDRRIGR